MEKVNDLLESHISAAKEERTVKTYFCSYYHSRLLGLQAKGHLGVTNKRVIFHASGQSTIGNSVIQSEVPIADVSGISSYKGTYFSFGHLLVALIVSSFISLIAASLVNLIGINTDYQVYQGIGWLVGIVALISSFAIKSDQIWRSVLAATSSLVVYSIGVSRVLQNPLSLILGQTSGLGWELVIAGLINLYALLCIFWYARRPAFSLMIGSKGGSSTPIAISGASRLGILDTSAGRALTAEPAEETEEMLKELGAVILDIQTLGDLGIKKWQTS